MRYLRLALFALLLYSISNAGRDATRRGDPAMLVPAAAQESWESESTEETPYGMINVHLFGMRNDQGEVLVNLYRRSRGFPFDHPLVQVNVRPRDGQADVDLGPLPFGTYAVSACHDENENGRCDTRLIGVPIEEAGSSNNPRKTWLAPFDFQASLFKLREEVFSLSIDMGTPK